MTSTHPVSSQAASSRLPRVGYILASSHSGSTLLAMLLGAHPDARTIGELKLRNITSVEKYRCSCQAPIGQCPFWSELQARMQRKGCTFSITDSGTSIHECPGSYAQRLLNPLYRGPIMEGIRDAALSLSPTWRRHLPRAQSNYRHLVETVLEMTGASCLIDSSKQSLQLKYMLRIPGLDVRAIKFIRDGRAVALTGVDKSRFADATDPALRFGGTGQSDGHPADSMAQATRNWRRSNEEAECLVATMDRTKWMEARYEELCANPTATLGRIFEFLGLDPARMRLNFREVQNHVVGNGMRFDKTSDIRVDERWRQHLSVEDLRIFEEVAGDLNRRYGYV